MDEVSISFLGLDVTDQPWVDVLLQYRRASLNPLGENTVAHIYNGSVLDGMTFHYVVQVIGLSHSLVHSSDPNVMFQASLSCSHLLLSNGTNGGRRHVTVMDMLQSGRTLMALATLLLAPVPLEEVI